ncbi:hypothetical protein, partial [Thioclava pacifica]
LIVPFVLHIWKNWRAMTNYFKRAPMALALALSLVAALAFAVPAALQSDGTVRRGPPQFAIAQAMFDAPLATVAPVFGLTEAEALAKLGATTNGQTLTQIAETQDSSAATLAQQLMQTAQ